MTLKFIGEAPAAKLAEIRSALAGARSDQPITLDFRGLGFFPNEKHPRVFWAGIEASPNLKTLAADIDKSRRLRKTLASRVSSGLFRPI